MYPWVYCNETKVFKLLLSRRIRQYPDFYCHAVLSIRKQRSNFFQQYVNMPPMYSTLYTANLGLWDFRMIQSHMLPKIPCKADYLFWSIKFLKKRQNLNFKGFNFKKCKFLVDFKLEEIGMEIRVIRYRNASKN